MTSTWSKRLARRRRGKIRWQDQLPTDAAAPRQGETFEQYRKRTHDKSVDNTATPCDETA